MGQSLSLPRPPPHAFQAVAGGGAEGERARLLLRVPRGDKEGPSGKQSGTRGPGVDPRKRICFLPKFLEWRMALTCLDGDAKTTGLGAES